MNYYVDINNIDRSREIENAFSPTLEDIKNDPEFYAELVNDLMYHWMYGTRETPLMNMAKRNYKIGMGRKDDITELERGKTEIEEAVRQSFQRNFNPEEYEKWKQI
jgi:hypothetical protein